MIEVGTPTNRPFGSKQTKLLVSNIYKKRFVREFFSRIGTPEMLLTPSSFPSCWVFRIKWKMAPFNDQMCVVKNFQAVVPVNLSSLGSSYFIQATFTPFFFFLDIQWRGQWRGNTEWKYTKWEEQREIFSSNIGDHWCHQITDLKHCHSHKYSRYNL